MGNYVLCCDWGTTTFRLRLVNTDDQNILGQIVSLTGIRAVFDSWNADNVDGLSRQSFFVRHLKTQVALLAGEIEMPLDGLPLVISGMASSSVGMYELPYGGLPLDLKGNGIYTHRIEQNSDFAHDIILISGVRSEYDVMRGEETQVIGLHELMNLCDRHSVLIFPGTHAKHLYINHGQLVDFKTYMTGEVFEVIASYSILKESVKVSDGGVYSEDQKSAFKSGVRESQKSGVLRNLFRVRTNQLFNTLSKQDNAMFMSGLLIGSEIKHLLNEIHADVVLCSGNNLYKLYNLAIEELNLSGRTTTVPAEIIEKATVVGQIKIFQNLSSRNA